MLILFFNDKINRYAWKWQHVRSTRDTQRREEYPYFSSWLGSIYCCVGYLPQNSMFTFVLSDLNLC